MRACQVLLFSLLACTSPTGIDGPVSAAYRVQDGELAFVGWSYRTARAPMELEGVTFREKVGRFAFEYPGGALFNVYRGDTLYADGHLLRIKADTLVTLDCDGVDIDVEPWTGERRSGVSCVVLRETGHVPRSAVETVEKSSGAELLLFAAATYVSIRCDIFGGRRVDLRTAEDLRPHFRTEVVRTSHSLYDAA